MSKPTNHLFWHIATYNDGTVSMAPPFHQLIAAAGIEVAEEATTAWIAMDPDVSVLVRRLDAAFSQAHHVTSFTGINFGLPILISNAFQHNVVIDTTLQKLNDGIVSHTDVAKELQRLTNPDGFMGFDLMCRLCSLPPRLNLDVAAAWQDPTLQKRIGKRLLVDVVLITLAYAHLQYVSNVWDDQQIQRFRHEVIRAAGQKAKIVHKMFPDA